ncbi:MAG: PepSY domain-containing protein [Firmicutes bacterium]|nr:PepSY domain-containing protein [Bacillota bacterium]
MTNAIRRVSIITLAVIVVIAMSASAFAGSLTKKEAVKKALNDAHTTKAGVYGLEAELDDGKYEIEFTKKKNNAEYDYEIKKTGRILEKSVDYVYKHNYSKHKIGKKAAKKKVAKFSGIKYSIINSGTCWFELDDGEGHYEVKFRKGHYKYDYEVLAPTGKIIEYSKNYVK